MGSEKTNIVNETLGLPLADAFEADLSAALAESGGVESVVLAMVDMDGLLMLNEAYGHAAGDKALIEMGKHLMAHAENARLYRYAGDCFAYLFNSDIVKEDAFLKMEAVRASYQSKSPDGVPLTITIGISSAPEDGIRYAELVRKADSAMYRGKANGKNRVCLAREEKMVTKTSHYTVEQLQRLTKLSKREGIGEAILLREALDALLQKYEV